MGRCMARAFQAEGPAGAKAPGGRDRGKMEGAKLAALEGDFNNVPGA